MRISNLLLLSGKARDLGEVLRQHSLGHDSPETMPEKCVQDNSSAMGQSDCACVVDVSLQHFITMERPVCLFRSHFKDIAEQIIHPFALQRT